MKKPYVKPEIQVISFTLSEAIAASSCVAQVYNHTKDGCQKLPPFDMPGIEFTFGASEQECADAPLEGYCYFTSSETMVFSS